MSTTTIEQRVSLLEAEVARLKTLIAPRDQQNWLARMDGSFKDEPAFEDLIRFGREIRQADRPAGDPGM